MIVDFVHPHFNKGIIRIDRLIKNTKITKEMNLVPKTTWQFSAGLWRKKMNYTIDVKQAQKRKPKPKPKSINKQ